MAYVGIAVRPGGITLLDGGWVLPNREDVGGIQLDGRRLLNQADRHDQASARAFADQDPAHACQGPPHHLHFHPFFEVRVGIKGKAARPRTLYGVPRGVKHGSGTSIRIFNGDFTWLL